MNITLTEIKNQYAQEHGYQDWNDLRKEFREKAITFTEMTGHENAVCIRAQKALKHPIYARIDHYKELEEKHKDDAYNNRKYTYKAAGLEDALRIVTNEENLIR